jgi:U32 family peptidase
MLIHAPISRRDAVEPLVAAGADSCYGGLLPDAEGNTPRAFLSRRHMPNDNFTSFEDLAATVRALHAHGRPFFLTLNEQFYAPEAFELACEQVDRTADLPLGGVIVADPGLLAALRARHPELALVASSVLALCNSAAIAFFRDRGVRRVILPRSLRPDEMAALAGAFPDVELECFLLNDRCPNIDGLCGFVHPQAGSPASRFRSLCRSTTAVAVGAREVGDAGPDVSPDRVRRGARFEADACGACALPELMRAGVRHAKIVGRNRPLDALVRDIAFLVAVRALARAAPHDVAALQRQIPRLRAEHYGEACPPGLCYYPDPAPSRPG